MAPLTLYTEMMKPRERMSQRMKNYRATSSSFCSVEHRCYIELSMVTSCKHMCLCTPWICYVSLPHHYLPLFICFNILFFWFLLIFLIPWWDWLIGFGWLLRTLNSLLFQHACFMVELILSQLESGPEEFARIPLILGQRICQHEL